MNDTLRAQIRSSQNQKQTDELIEIWQRHDLNEWSELTFDVIRDILIERQVELPAQGKPSEQENDIDVDKITKNHTLMLKEIRSWGFWSLGLGLLHIITAGFLNASWGILLIIVGLASFYFRAAPMFIIYAVTLTWAALSNLSSWQINWVIFAVFQIYLAFRVFLRYRRFHNNEMEFAKLHINDPNDGTQRKERTARFFPWIGVLLSCSSILGVVLSVVLVSFIFALYGDAIPPSYFNLIVGIVVNFGILGFSVSLASLVSKYRPKGLVIIGLIIGGLLSIFFLAINLGLLRL